MLRVTGLSMSEISRDVGVPVSTLNQWAGQNAWLLSDLTEEIAAQPLDESLLPSRDAAADVGSSVVVAQPVSGTDGAPDLVPGLVPALVPSPVKAAVRALAHAEALTAAGQLAAADKAVRLAERLFGIAAKTGVMGAVEGDKPWDGLLASGETEQQAAERRDAEYEAVQTEMLDIRRNLFRCQAFEIEKGNIPEYGESFNSFLRKSGSILSALSMGMMPAKIGSRTEYMDAGMFHGGLRLGDDMRKALIKQGVLPENFLQAEEIAGRAGLYEEFAAAEEIRTKEWQRIDYQAMQDRICGGLRRK